MRNRHIRSSLKIRGEITVFLLLAVSIRITRESSRDNPSRLLGRFIIISPRGHAREGQRMAGEQSVIREVRAEGRYIYRTGDKSRKPAMGIGIVSFLQ